MVSLQAAHAPSDLQQQQQQQQQAAQHYLLQQQEQPQHEHQQVPTGPMHQPPTQQPPSAPLYHGPQQLDMGQPQLGPEWLRYGFIHQGRLRQVQRPPPLPPHHQPALHHRGVVAERTWDEWPEEQEVMYKRSHWPLVHELLQAQVDASAQVNKGARAAKQPSRCLLLLLMLQRAWAGRARQCEVYGSQRRRRRGRCQPWIHTAPAPSMQLHGSQFTLQGCPLLRSSSLLDAMERTCLTVPGHGPLRQPSGST